MIRLFPLIIVLLLLRNGEGITLDPPVHALSSSAALQHQPPLDLTNPDLVLIQGPARIIHVMNYKTQQEVSRINVGKDLSLMKFTPDGRYFLLWSQLHNKISILNTQTWQQEENIISLKSSPTDLKITSDLLDCHKPCTVVPLEK
ncbi:hypothetical protein [Candidatus Odyssella acanthamoebae]|nr:hypothetical protein [Candidatus Paracaedibacter acanthamoebae]